MDRHKVQNNRHKKKEVFKSGSEKRKIAKEKEKKNEEVLSKSRRMTDFIVKCGRDPSTPIFPVAAENNGGLVHLIDDGDSNAKVDISLTSTSGSSRSSALSQTQGLTEDYKEVKDVEIITKMPMELEIPLEPGPALNTNISLTYDIGKWPDKITVSDIENYLIIDMRKLQNCNVDLFESKSQRQLDTGKGDGKSFTRTCQRSFFERKTRNGENIKRSWLCFSPSNGHIYCCVCKLFSPTSSKFTHGGFCDWKNATARLIEHETSKNHVTAVTEFAGRTKRIGLIDQELTRQAEDTAKYWREVLKRLISVIVFISERGLAFRGENQKLGSPKNGNYLGILELVAEYDEFLRQHIKTHGNRGKGHTNYLSATICEEVLNIIAKQVFDEIILRIKKSRYFSISLDSTPDEGHIDQLSLVFRYLEDYNPVERFVRFMPNQGHKAKDMFRGLSNFLKENELDIKNCRGQSYDNASSMSGKYNGLQALVKEENNLAVWIPCAGHSLNLVLQAAAGCCLKAVSFFDFLEELFVFFTASSNKFKILTESLNRADSEKCILVLKRISTTRWSCRADATKALLGGYKEIKKALFDISENKEESAKSRIIALSLLKTMAKLETGIYALFWNDILAQVNRTSETLQNPRLDLNTATSMISSLKDFIQSKRDIFYEYEERAITLTDCTEYGNESRRQRKVNVRLAEIDSFQAPEVELLPKETFRTQSYLTIIDEFDNALRMRLQAYELVNTRFGFLNKLHSLSNDEIISSSKILVETYEEDLDDELANELIQFKSFCVSMQLKSELEKRENEHISVERWMYQLMLENNLKECFPNVEVVLRIYLTLMVTNCSAERSFSKLKLIKNRLRTSMLEDRLNNVALLNIENDVLRQMNFDQTIQTFVTEKLRRQPISITS